MSDDRQTHWDKVYTTKGEQEVSWFEDSPELSLRLIDAAGIDATADPQRDVSQFLRRL